jgi:hypothetical protein
MTDYELDQLVEAQEFYAEESRRGWQMLQVAMWLGLAEVCGLAYWLLW